MKVSIVVFIVSLTLQGILAQEPKDIHPWQTECGNYGCFVDWFCNGETDLCEPCPKEGVNVAESDCLILGASNSTRVQNCLTGCIRQQEGEICSTDRGCEEREAYCDYANEEEGTCQPCKTDVSECEEDGLLGFALEECILCDLRYCVPLHFSVTQVDGKTIESLAMNGSPSMFAAGQVAKCENLIYEEKDSCEDEDVAGKICLVDDSTKNTYYISVVRKCAALGGIGAIFYGDYSPRTPTNETWRGSLSFQISEIPSVSVSFDDGKRLEELSQSIVSINTTDIGNACFMQQFCSDDRPCAGSNEGRYCDYKWGKGEGDGSCRACPVDADGNPNPLACFFTFEDTGRVTGQKAVEECAETCASELEFPKCKFCPNDISGFDFGVENEAEKCEFCPEDDVLFPDKNFTLFGEGVKCWQVKQFFDSVEVSADAKNCRLATMMSYVCGCKGEGYSGANTETKKKVLAWLPRIMAIISFFSSAFIVYDTSRSQELRKKLMNQLLAMLSIFDMLGAVGYAFTTLPIPKDYEFGPIYGAKGSEGFCSTQGFLIQLGTTSAYTNVSLSVYYMLIIVYGWSEQKMNKYRLPLMLCPIAVGLAFAFAGLPHYDPLNLWCNNTANWWPDIPVAAAIGLATIIMSTICWNVSSTESKTRKYHTRAGNDGRSSFSSKVFWQSFWYLMAFYLTWPLYLALQYAWAGGTAFTRYGFILTAGTMVPLQGWWNLIVYIRPRYGKNIINSISKAFGSTSFSGLGSQKSSQNMSSSNMNSSSKLETRSNEVEPSEQAQNSSTHEGTNQQWSESDRV